MNDIHDNHQKLRVGILFGGKSAEHEVSLQSAQNVLAALDKTRFDPVLLGVDKQGGWHLLEQPKLPIGNTPAVGFNPQLLEGVDVVFPLVHGPLGEDGSMQGLLEIISIPYVGCGVLGSAIGMDKDVMKRLLRDAGIKVTDCHAFTEGQQRTIDVQSLVAELGLPLFVKPANMGSSVGVTKVDNKADLLAAINLAFRYDRKVLVERAVIGDEVECAVLGNEQLKVSVPGRIACTTDFYSYEAKYLDRDNTVLEIPAKLAKQVSQAAQATALQAYKVLGCEGMARVDMFVTERDDIVVNEINTLPGFTKFSMYPQLWEASGLSYPDLITKLILLALDRSQKRQKLLTTYVPTKPAL